MKFSISLGGLSQHEIYSSIGSHKAILYYYYYSYCFWRIFSRYKVFIYSPWIFLRFESRERESVKVLNADVGGWWGYKLMGEGSESKFLFFFLMMMMMMFYYVLKSQRQWPMTPHQFIAFVFIFRGACSTSTLCDCEIRFSFSLILCSLQLFSLGASFPWLDSISSHRVPFKG